MCYGFILIPNVSLGMQVYKKVLRNCFYKVATETETVYLVSKLERIDFNVKNKKYCGNENWEEGFRVYFSAWFSA